MEDASLLHILEPLNIPLVLLGLVSLVRLTYLMVTKVVEGVTSYLLPLVLGPGDLVGQYGAWGLVTGCTSGIGREYAMGLASKGLNIVLVARNRDKLQLLEKELVERFGVATMIVEANFTHGEAAVEGILKQLEEAGVEVGVLVNNVGMSVGMRPFCEVPRREVVDLIRVNITAATMLSHGLLPAMATRGRGAIINIGSTSGLIRGPYVAAYTASKHYIHAFTEALAAEYRPSGITIQEITPNIVETGMTAMFSEHSGSWMMPSAELFVRWSLRSLGWAGQTCGYWVHSLALPIMVNMPLWMAVAMFKDNYEKKWKKKQ